MTAARHPSANPARPAVPWRDAIACGDNGSIPLFTGGRMHQGGVRDKASKVHEVTIHSLGEFIDRVTPLEPDAKTGRRRDTGIYRGASDAEAPLLTSLDRLGGTSPAHTKADLEEHVLRNFIRYSRPHLGTERVDDWELLVSAQHHGVPTRLLDWTYSPLVAAFFATRPNDEERDRAVWR